MLRICGQGLCRRNPGLFSCGAEQGGAERRAWLLDRPLPQPPPPRSAEAGRGLGREFSLLQHLEVNCLPLFFASVCEHLFHMKALATPGLNSSLPGACLFENTTFSHLFPHQFLPHFALHFTSLLNFLSRSSVPASLAPPASLVALNCFSLFSADSGLLSPAFPSSPFRVSCFLPVKF